MNTNIKPQALRPKPVRAAVTRSPRVLVIDDEATLRSLCSRMLRPRYEVVECTSATQALDLLKASVVDLVLTDLEMPEMTGLALIERLRQSHPELPIILMTGRNAGDARCQRAGNLGVPVLTKPFSQQDLLALVEAPAVAAGGTLSSSGIPS
ncbi:MAG TPA: response regulator [Candidatus Xenobia bacterium]|jgi:CheY-like chemotaxis protein